MGHDEYHFPLGLSNEEKSALIWKIEQDYEQAEMRAVMYKEEYLTFAVNFYTRNIYSLEDVVEQYREHCNSIQRKRIADAFLTDMKARLRERELAHN